MSTSTTAGNGPRRISIRMRAAQGMVLLELEAVGAPVNGMQNWNLILRCDPMWYGILEERVISRPLLASTSTTWPGLFALVMSMYPEYAEVDPEYTVPHPDPEVELRKQIESGKYDT